MKVLIHLNHGIDRSYMLNFGKSVTKKDVAKLVDAGVDNAVSSLFAYAAIRSIGKVEIPTEDKRKAELGADFTLSQHSYISERLS